MRTGGLINDLHDEMLDKGRCSALGSPFSDLFVYFVLWNHNASLPDKCDMSRLIIKCGSETKVALFKFS
jgi:hypothetical protein